MRADPIAVLLHDGAAVAGMQDAVDTLEEAAHVARALERLGYRAWTLPVDLNLGLLEHRLREIEPDLVFNLVESINGAGQLIAVVPALLESLRIPFTGCGALAHALTSNKPAAKRQLGRAGIPAPADYAAGAPSDPGSWIVKAVWEHSSLGIDDASVVSGSAAVPALLERRRASFGGEWFAERYIEGRELNVALLASDRGLLSLPVSEILFVDYPPEKPRILSYAAKWNSESPDYRQTVRAFVRDPELCGRAEQLARSCWELFDLRGYARVDFRVDADGRLWVLEINANPCLSADAGFCAALAEAGIEFDRAIAWLVDGALGRMMGPDPGAARSVHV